MVQLGISFNDLDVTGSQQPRPLPAIAELCVEQSVME